MDKQDKYQAILEERRGHFKLQWFSDLLSARLGLSETFWLGSVGTSLLLVIPGAMFVIWVGFTVFPESVVLSIYGVWLALAAFFNAVLVSAVFRAALRTPEVGLWRWSAVLVSALICIGIAAGSFSILSGL